MGSLSGLFSLGFTLLTYLIFLALAQTSHCAAQQHFKGSASAGDDSFAYGPGYRAWQLGKHLFEPIIK